MKQTFSRVRRRTKSKPFPKPITGAKTKDGNIVFDPDVEHLVLVEGISDIGVVEALIESLNTLNNVHIHSTDSQNNLKNDLPLFKEAIEDCKDRQLKTLLILQDADTNPDWALKNIQALLTNKDDEQTPESQISLATPLQSGDSVWDKPLDLYIGIYIVGNQKGEGALESLLLETQRLSPAFSTELKCVDDFIDCLSAQSLLPQQKDKLRLKTFLLTHYDAFPTSESGFSPKPKLNLPALWTANDPVFIPLKTFLGQLAHLPTPEISP